MPETDIKSNSPGRKPQFTLAKRHRRPQTDLTMASYPFSSPMEWAFLKVVGHVLRFLVYMKSEEVIKND
jgi:hypothetical protein